MTSVTFNVPDISCEHCQQAITSALLPVDGIDEVRVNIPGKQVYVSYNATVVDIERMESLLADEDYPVASVAGYMANGMREQSRKLGCSCIARYQPFVVRTGYVGEKASEALKRLVAVVSSRRNSTTAKQVFVDIRTMRTQPPSLEGVEDTIQE